MTNRFAKRAEKVKASEIREILKYTEKPEMISFAGGLPAPELFPVEEIMEVCSEVLKNEGQKALQYGSTEGYGPLRQFIVDRMKKVGINTSVDQTIITTGSQQGLDLTGMIFLDEGDTVICESPTYLAAINAFKAYMPKFVGIEMDEEGMIMEELEKALIANPQAKFIYTIPDYQNPTGRTMSINRRKRLVELANQYDVIVVEDNPYGELNFEGEILPPVKHFDTEDRVVYLSTFSKILAPGLRVAWICANPEIIHKYVLFKQGTDLHTNIMAQMMTAKYTEMFDIEKHIARIKEVYKRRRDLMLDAIKKEFPDNVKVTNPQGGLFLWVELPNNINAREVLVKCLENNVAFVPGGSFFPNQPKENTCRLNFSNMSEDKIVEGIRRLAEVLKTALA